MTWAQNGSLNSVSADILSSFSLAISGNCWRRRFNFVQPFRTRQSWTTASLSSRDQIRLTHFITTARARFLFSFQTKNKIKSNKKGNRALLLPRDGQGLPGSRGGIPDVQRSQRHHPHRQRDVRDPPVLRRRLVGICWNRGVERKGWPNIDVGWFVFFCSFQIVYSWSRGSTLTSSSKPGPKSSKCAPTRECSSGAFARAPTAAAKVRTSRNPTRDRRGTSAKWRNTSRRPWSSTKPWWDHCPRQVRAPSPGAHCLPIAR